MKLWCTLLTAGMVEGVPLRTVVMYGRRSHELNAPWSLDSRHVLKSKLEEISAPPPKPSLKLMAARGML